MLVSKFSTNKGDRGISFISYIYFSEFLINTQVLIPHGSQKYSNYYKYLYVISQWLIVFCTCCEIPYSYLFIPFYDYTGSEFMVSPYCITCTVISTFWNGNTFVFSYIIYCITIWGNACHTYLDFMGVRRKKCRGG